MVLGASFEFDKSHNSEIVERPSDNEEVPVVCQIHYSCLLYFPRTVSTHCLGQSTCSIPIERFIL